MGRFEIFLCSNQYLCGRIKLQEFIPELFRQMLWYDYQSLIGKPQTLGLHNTCNHFEGLAGSYRMSQQSVATK